MRRRRRDHSRRRAGAPVAQPTCDGDAGRTTVVACGGDAITSRYCWHFRTDGTRDGSAAAPAPSAGDELPPLPEDITAAAEVIRSGPQKEATTGTKAARDEDASNALKAAKNEEVPTLQTSLGSCPGLLRVRPGPTL